MKNLKVYIASGWFNKEQVHALKEMEAALAELNYEVYSPRVESIFKPGMDHEKIVQDNLSALHHCDFVLASTEGKDMGTLFECGYASAIKKPVVYYYKGEGNFNIMLAATGEAVLTNRWDLFQYLEGKARGEEWDKTFEGGME